MTDKKVRVGMIGLGGISYAHEAGYSELQDGCEIVAMCDVNEEEATNRAGMYNAKVYTRYQDLLDNPDVDMVDITVPHMLHHEITLAALARGKHVLVEKPIAVTSKLGWEMVEAARKAGVKFSVAENTPFIVAYQAVEKLLNAGTLGDIRTVRTMIAGSEVYRLKDPNLWHGKAPYGGVILDSAVHNIYLYKWLFGGVKEVLGFGTRVVPESETEDNGLIIGHLANGAEFQLYTTCTAEIPWTERLEVYGTKAGVIVDQLCNPVVKYYNGSEDIDGTVIEDVPFDPLAWKFMSMGAEIKDFVGAIIEDRPPRLDPADAVYAVEVVEAIDRSIQSKQWVTL
ncbi:MAG TPA: Gfo/Idh/MocA family oxidoreductase [Longilinea sp.]|nr:Gfo/Idh/MocA family oxidoreductase [Longilinea sp.]